MAQPNPLPVPNAPNAPTFAIVYDLNVPELRNGGIASLIPPGHAHAGRSDSYYYRKITSCLIALGYSKSEYSFYSKQTTQANAINLQTQPDLTWMPYVMKKMHVVEYCHAGSL